MKKRRVILLLLVFFTGLLLAMTTYAWFSTNKIFEIESFDIQVATKGGIEISSDGINWSGVIGMLELVEAQNTYPSNINQIPNNVMPVSTGGMLENGLMKMYSGEVEITDDFYLLARREKEDAGISDESSGKFVAFDIFIKSSMPKNLKIDALSGISYLTETSTGIENAFRIAFVEQGNTSSESAIRTIQSMQAGLSTFIWEPNYNTHNENAILHALNTYGLNVTNNNAPLEIDGIIQDISRTDKIKVSSANAKNYPAYFKKVTPNLYTKTNNDQISPFVRINAGVTKFRVYVWLEGQDIDCEDGASYGNLAINLQFVAE